MARADVALSSAVADSDAERSGEANCRCAREGPREFTGDPGQSTPAGIDAARNRAVIANTDTATGVDVELKIAKEEEKAYFLLKGYKLKDCKKPKSGADDTMYAWNWDNLKKLIGGAR